MGNKLESVSDSSTGEPITDPAYWVRHIILQNYEEFAELYKKLPRETQLSITKLVDGRQIFEMSDADRE